MNVSLGKKVEIIFWDLWIQAISETPWLQKTLQTAYRLLHGRSLIRLLLEATGVGLAGFATGFTFIVLLNAVR